MNVYEKSGVRFVTLLTLVSMLVGCDGKITIDVSPDGTVRTPEEARDAVRAAKRRLAAEKRGDVPIEVVFADGTYACPTPLELTSEDSGTPSAPVTWRAAHRGKAVLRGSTRLAWRRPGAADADRLALLPAAARDKVVVADLPHGARIPGFLRGNQTETPSNDIPLEVFSPKGRLTCARWPNGREALTEAVYDTHTFGVDARHAAAWAREPDLWSFGLWCHDWIELHAPLRVVDAAAGKVAYPKEHGCPLSCKMNYARPFHVYNAFSELDRPGEWVVDRTRRTLWLWPGREAEKKGEGGGEGGEGTEVVLGDGLVRAKGTSDVTFDGFVFERCRLTAVQVSGSTRVRIVASTFRDTCSWGVKVTGGSDCRVEGCDFYELGEGGAYLEGGELKTLTPGNHAAVNCHFHHLGRTLFNYRPAVYLRGVGNRAEHNLVHHLRHAGILFGGNDHYVGWNVLHDVVDNYDAGAIYSWQNSWARRGGVIEHNLVHVSGKKPNPTTTMGIYLDDHTSDVDVRYNIVDYASQGAHNGGGQLNRWHGNVFLNASAAYNVNQRGGAARLTAELTNATSVCQSEVWKRRYPNAFRYLGMEEHLRTWGPGLVLTNNLFVSCGPERNLDSEATAKIMAATVTIADNAVTMGDPGFRDYAGFDWRAAPDSPYRARIDACGFEKMGLFESDLRASPAVKFGADMSPAFALGEPPKDSPEVTIWVSFDRFDAERKCARDCFLCSVIRWGPPRIRSMASVDLAPDRPWHVYRFAFTPEADAAATFEFGGSGGVATEYRNVRIAGADVERPQGDRTFSGRKGGETKFKVNVRKGVPVVVTYEARKGD